MRHSIGDGPNDNDAKRKNLYVLLKFKISIKCHKDIAYRMSTTQQLAVLYPRPAKTVWTV